ncbi:MAG: hypothetical protein J6V88_05255 [Kiritimatiellae bacterium]|nr:hypothetical protein [Kiritimatiellia bacterium]
MKSKKHSNFCTTRRDFVAGIGAFAGLSLTGCSSFKQKEYSKARFSPYWCTWNTQYLTLETKQLTGELNFPGDQGVPGTRDNMNETVLFGKNGWINLFPKYRGDLMFIIDDGWDVPYGANNDAKGIAQFSSLVPDRKRFPSLGGANVSDRDRLRVLARRVEEKGWKGLGVWVACQAYGETFSSPFPKEKLAEDLRKKFDEAAYAGIKYWKVDWGVHNFDVWYRRMMSEMKEQYYPELIIDHCRGFNNAINGQVDPHLKPKDKYHTTGKTGRIFGVSEYDAVTRDCEEIMSFSDVFRTYDSAHPLTTATMLERAAWELHAADKSSSRVVINTEDEPLIAAGLGIELSMMRCPWVPEPEICRVRPLHKRMAEDYRCITWQRIATPFGSDTSAKTLHSDNSIREEWHFIPDECWFTGKKDVTYFQVAPASVTRGIALPEVKGENGEIPYVVASRNPNGALTFSALPLIDSVKKCYTPKAEARFDAALEKGTPVAVFGKFGSLVLDDCTDGRRIVARDIIGGDAVDITDKCVKSAGKIALPGEEIAKIGASMNPNGDDSNPGAIVEVM